MRRADQAVALHGHVGVEEVEELLGDRPAAGAQVGGGARRHDGLAPALAGRPVGVRDALAEGLHRAGGRKDGAARVGRHGVRPQRGALAAHARDDPAHERDGRVLARPHGHAPQLSRRRPERHGERHRRAGLDGEAGRLEAEKADRQLGRQGVEAQREAAVGVRGGAAHDGAVGVEDGDVGAGQRLARLGVAHGALDGALRPGRRTKKEEGGEGGRKAHGVGR